MKLWFNPVSSTVTTPAAMRVTPVCTAPVMCPGILVTQKALNLDH